MKFIVFVFLPTVFFISPIPVTPIPMKVFWNMGQGTGPHHRVIGGQNALPGQIPYILNLMKNNHHVCGANLLQDGPTGRQYGLTAAHCVREGTRTPELRVTAGSLHVTGEGSASQSRTVERILRHPRYDDTTAENDIAIFLFSNQFNITDLVSPISLPEGDESDLVNHGTISGWGLTNFAEETRPQHLQVAEVYVYSNDECHQMHQNRTVLSSHICAGDLEGGISGCHGDSGGPLATWNGTANTLIGITSWGARGCPAYNFPGVYTRVSNFTKWIRETLAEL